MIQFEHVCKSYGKTPILKDLSFTIDDGQFVVLIGPSGCGKTTTLKTINRLIDIDSGTISIDGKNIYDQDKVSLRRHIGYVIQQIGLFPNMTVAQNICVVPKLLKSGKGECDKIVQDMLRLVHMEQYADKYPSELSGGQQQRIGVLRALAASPPIVLMDEPFSTMGGEAASARSTPIRCCCPPESSEGYLSAYCSMWTSRSISCTILSHSLLPAFSSFGTTQIFCATVMLGNRPICWIT